MSLSHAKAPTRRTFCLCCMAAPFAATGAWLTPSEVFAQARAIVLFIKADAKSADIIVHPLRGNIFVLEGSGGNIAAVAGKESKLLVDAGIGVSRPRIFAALQALGQAPVKRLINTHWHFDHTDGNEWIHSIGAEILAHENTLKRLSTAQRVEGWVSDFPQAPSGAMPTEVFADEKILKHEDNTLALKYYGPAHTDGDISVLFTEADILHTGDIYWNGIYPFIDYSTGGSINGTIKAAEASLAMITDKTIVIPGHGHPVSNKSELQAYRDMLVTIRDNVAGLKEQGRSLDEILAAQPTAAYDDKWGNFVIDPKFFTRLVYEGV